ncbi:DNA-binding protein WhiA [Mycoplasma zalophidermidis]|uniref:Probable cell division protein WhiA n=1 Tax=Mycoplasma zalophidermidis TaxID=398174 RepID=A0ABS6DRR7_9MOLU|nr:DNA-binding protein WhiA [Mycoplasma zalophidermidis]MBU4693702.1 DNA-binding protein WhiA [Mycoplasma zalophidermidis]
MDKTNFTQKIKNEIFSKKRNKDEISEFLRGFIFANCTQNEFITLKITSNETLDYILILLNFININYSLDKNQICINKNDFNLEVNFKDPASFFAGAFVGGGTISDLNKSSYHLQLSSNYEKFIDIFMNKLNEYDFGFQKIFHRKKFLIYIKKHEKISDFLKAINVIDSMFKLEDSRIKRDFDNTFNRINNIDLANLKRIVKSNQQHLKNIDYIYHNNLESCFTEKQLEFFTILKNNPDESLSKISEILLDESEIKISKSGLNHWLIKLREIVKKYKNN